MKIILKLFLSFFLAAIIGGCGRRTESNITTIRWCADPNPIRKEQIAVFERENPDIKVNLDWATAGSEKVLVQIAGGNPPDIFMVYSLANFVSLIEKGALEDLTPHCEKHDMDIDDFWPQVKPFIFYEDNVYGFPETLTPVVLFYNKRLFEEANVSYPTEEWNWDDLLDAAQKLTKEDQVSGRYAQFGLLPGDLVAMIWQNGGDMFTPDGKRCIIDSPEALEAARFYYDLRYKHHVSPTPSEMESLHSQWGGFSIFATGRVAMMMTGRVATIEFRKYKDLDWDIAHVPRGRRKLTTFGVHTNVIPKDAKHKEAAFKFLKSLVSKEGELLVANYGEGIPSRRSIASSQEFLFNPEYPKEIHNQIYLDEMQNARLWSLFAFSPYVSPIETLKIWEQGMGKMRMRSQNPEEILHNIAKRLNQLLTEEK